VTISPVGPTQREIGKPGDRVSWSWNITPKEPGDYILDLIVMTYHEKTDNPLYVLDPPIEIDISVTNTWSHRFKSMVGWILGFALFIGAVGTILIFFREQVFAPLKNFRKRASTASSRDYDDLG
jgi:hypothetical protein